MDIIINKCPNNEKYFTSIEDENLHIYSCNIVKCPICIHGICEHNVCNCHPGWTGTNCEINPKFKRKGWLPWIFYTFGSIELIFIVALIVLTIYFREMKEIKIGKPFFLISILLGIILQILIIFLTYHKPSALICTTKIWFKYIGNAFIFGSIIVKCYQIANIYNVKKSFKTITNKTILRYYIVIVMIHIAILLIWTLLDDVQTNMKGYTTNGEEFEICSSPKTSLIGTLFSCFFIFICIKNIYETRHLPSNLKEPLGLPIYAYSLHVLMDILITSYINTISTKNNEINDSISPDIIYSGQCISILIFSPIVAYKLNFLKIYNIIYDVYLSDTNEDEVNKQNVTVDPGLSKVKRQSERINRDNPRFALSSINFL